MNSINDILNQIGDLQCMISGKTISIQGILSKRDGKVLLYSKIDSNEKIKEINDNNPLYIWGNINSTPVTILRGYINSIHEDLLNVGPISIIIDPSEIIIGCSYSDCSNGISVTQISASITALNYMFTSKPLEFSHDFSRNNPAILNYTYSEPITANDEFGKLQIYQTFSREWSWDKITCNIIPIIEYNFKEPKEIMEAVARIAAVRNLFSFFANHYLPLENITFSDKQCETEESPVFCNHTLYLNHHEDIFIPNEPFLIMTNVFNGNFQSIWEKWLELYENARPIPTLFYEIICDRSTRINSFLNLSQAIEVYSYRYRESNAESIRAKHKNKDVYLKHRIEDILTMLNFSLNLNANDIESMAKALADMRNYFTHYNIKRYIEPTYDEVFAAERILRFLLLGIVYTLLGIDSEHIKSRTKRVYFSNLTTDFKTVLGYKNRRS